MNLALFDFDGTITTRETFPDFMRAVVSPGRLAIGRVLLAPLIVGYRLGMVSGTLVRAEIVKFGLRGVAEAGVALAGEAFARDVLPQLLRTEALQRIQWHVGQGDTVVVVSGGFDVYLAHWCRQHGLELICSGLESASGKLTGRYRGKQCVGAEKCRRVRERYELAASRWCTPTATLRRTSTCSTWPRNDISAGEKPPDRSRIPAYCDIDYRRGSI